MFDVLATIVVLMLISVFYDSLARLFTNEEEVVSIIESVSWVMIVYIFFDGIHGVQAGIIRGIGR